MSSVSEVKNMRVEYSATCQECLRVEVVAYPDADHRHTEASAQLRRLGWVLTRRGWLCSECVNTDPAAKDYRRRSWRRVLGMAYKKLRDNEDNTAVHSLIDELEMRLQRFYPEED